jgi:predicted site-specific integrase-resolvase
MNQENAHELNKKYLTQQEVADLFRVKPGTVKNWRDAGYLDYFQVPGSSRVLYPAETINHFERQHTKRAKVIEFRRPEQVKREEPGLSSNRIKKQWRI